MNCDLEKIVSLLQRSNPQYSENDMFSFFQRNQCVELFLLLANTPERQEKIKKQYLINAKKTMAHWEACSSFFELLNDCQISYATLKGAVLSKMIYNNEMLRQSSDIDIIIDSKDVSKVRTLLKSQGFLQGKIINQEIVSYNRHELLYYTVNTHQQAPFIKKNDNQICPYIMIDLNTDLMWGESNKTLNVADFLSNIESTVVCGIHTKKLSPPAEFVALCLHHYKDMNSIYLLYTRGLSLRLFFDIYNYLEQVAPDIQQVAKIAQKFRVSRYVAACIFNVRQFFGIDIDELVLPYLNALGEWDLRDTFGLNERESYFWNIELYDRFFPEKLQKYFDCVLNEKEKKKIQTNLKWMN